MYFPGFEDRPFWLYEYTEQDSWQAASSIKANVPYLISMPNDPAYIEEYRVGGSVTFTGIDVDMQTSDEESLVVGRGSLRSFHPVYQQVQIGEISGFLALNTESWRGHPEGSVFVRNQRALRPFEAYFLNETSEAKEEWFGVFDGTTDVSEIHNGQNGMYNRTDMVYDMAGRKVGERRKKRVETRNNNGKLKAGLYIVNGRKVVVK